MQADNNRLGNLIAPLAKELLSVTSDATSAVSFSDAPTIVVSNSSSFNRTLNMRSNLYTQRRVQALCGGQTAVTIATASTLAQMQISLSIDEVNDLIISEGLSLNVSMLTKEEILSYLASAISLRLARKLSDLSSSASSSAIDFLSGMQACSGNVTVSFSVQVVAAIPGILPGFPSSSSPVSSPPAPPYYIIGIVLGLVIICIRCIVVARKRQSEKNAHEKSTSVVLRTTV